MRYLLPLLAALGCASRLNAAVDFARDVLPILSENCFACHGPDEKARKGDLRLDTKDDALRTVAPVVVPGKSGESELVRRLTTDDPREVMPPPKAKKTLTPQQVATLKRWIDEGAAWGKHWAFDPPRRGNVPSTKYQISNPIDAFVFARLEKEGLKPSPEAAKETLIRRVTLDLTGLPPTPAEVDAFLKDTGPDAYSKVVERLLASPRYGERMVWEWLDAARYADSNGYQGDQERTMWPWRDWAVQALNADLPFDRFTVEQLAGDLLPNATRDQKLATGFLRNHMINGEGGRIPEENRVEYVMDMAETVGTVWLGLTFNCCRCHDHKFDPLKQTEYYGLFAFFNQTPVTGGGGDPQGQPAIEVAPEGEPAKIGAIAGGAAVRRLPRVMVMADQAKPRDTFVYLKGLYNKPGDKVSAGVPAVLGRLPTVAPRNRLTLANWLVSADNPLTARVVVNREWQRFFGVGLVKTVEDFGVQGERPPNQELLDWLAVEFREKGWSLKRLVRLIVTSAAYRQSSKVTPALAERDPENRLLARGPRYRLPSWMIRDQALAASGLMVPAVGGKPVHPYQPPGVWEEATFGQKKYAQDHGDALYRRSLYTFWRRIVGPTAFFDAGSRQTCTVKQARTNTPLHALATLNDVTYVEAARALAERVMAEPDDGKRVEAAYRRVLARRPSAEEATVLLAGLDRLRKQYRADPGAAKKLLAVGESKRNEKLDPAEHAAVTGLCLTVLNLDEALTKE
jgi:hypothetical protein